MNNWQQYIDFEDDEEIKKEEKIKPNQYKKKYKQIQNQDKRFDQR